MFNTSNVQCEALDDLRHGRWTKLLWNIPFNGLGAVLDKTTDQLLADAQGEALVRSIMEEVVAAARGADVKLSADLIDKNISNTRTMGAYHTSTQLDRQFGRAMEVETIFGRPLQIGQAAGIPTSRLGMLYDMIRLVDPGRGIAR